MVLKPIQSVSARDSAITRPSQRRSCTLPSTKRMNSSSSRLTLLRMLLTRDSLRRELRENVVQALGLRHLDFQGVIIREHRRESRQLRGGGARLAQIEHEHFGLQLAQHIRHAVALDDVAALDDGDVAAQILGLFQIVRGEDDGGALRVDACAGTPTWSGESRCRRRRSAHPGSASCGSCIRARAIMRRRFMPPDSERATELRRSQSCSCFRYFSARCFASGRGMP